MTTANPFVLEPDQYKRDIDILRHSVEQAALYLSKKFGKALDYCRQYVANALKRGGRFEFKDPEVTYLRRQENGDRTKEVTTLSKYLGTAVKRGALIAPTLTIYKSEAEHPSVLGEFIEENVKLRSKAKKAQFAAESLNDSITALLKKIEQTNRKLANNSCSGAHVTPSNPLYNKSAHSTLTSNCRSTSAYGNANNEKFLEGNRHYWNHHIVLNNITSIIAGLDVLALENVVRKYNIHIPTHSEVMACIKYSTDLYWTSPYHLDKIRQYVETLSPIECVGFVYIGDMFHLRKHNAQLAREFIAQLSDKVTSGTDFDDPVAVIHSLNEAIVNHAHQVCRQETQGIGKDYSKARSPNDVQIVAKTAKNIQAVVTKYADLISAFWVTKHMPASVAHFPTSVRRCAITSDTDSTIFTVQNWVLWYKNKISFDQEAMSVASSMIYLASSTIAHQLAMMSANFGIATKRIHQIEMKNEFKFDVFVATNMGKHYFANISCQEGNVQPKHKIEIKGVGLKSASLPVAISKRAEEMMESVMRDVMQDGTVSIRKYLAQVADIERNIMASIYRCESTYLKTTMIKDAASYTKSELESPYLHHYFWNEVFGPSYGMMPTPPYDTLKVSVNTTSTTAFNQWVASIEDTYLRARLKEFCSKHQKSTISTLMLPMQILGEKGFPKEIIPVIDARKVVIDLCTIFYHILETLGVYVHEDKVQRLVSDYHSVIVPT